MTDSSLTPDIRTRLTQIADVTLDEHTTFADLTTLHLGGRPRLTVRCGTSDAIAEVVMLLGEAGVPLLVVGGGSNLVVADGDRDEVAVILENDTLDIDADSGLVHVGAGSEWDEVVAATVEAGLGGIECLSGIPGSAGGTPVQNVGAYGAEIANVLTRVRLLERSTGKTRWVPVAALDLGYRYSNLKYTRRAVVLELEMQLNPDGMSVPLRFGELTRRLGTQNPGERRPVAEVREAVLALRDGKGMVLIDGDHDTWSAGSFFTNPVVDMALANSVQASVRASHGPQNAGRMPRFQVGEGKVKLSAAWLIERAGFTKGYPGEGSPVRLSTKHTLALTNRGPATTADLVTLAREVRDGVRERFGVNLEPEPVWIGVAL